MGVVAPGEKKMLNNKIFPHYVSGPLNALTISAATRSFVEFWSRSLRKKLQ